MPNAMLAVETMPVEAIHPYPSNPRRLSDRAVEKVAASIKAFGFRQPIVVDANMVVVVGHTRLLAAKALGLPAVPVHIARELSAAEAKAYRIADNRTNEETSWDAGLLRLELADLQTMDFDLSLTTLAPGAIARFTDNVESPQVDLTPPPNPVSREGEMWMLGRHRLICGDGTDGVVLRRLMQGERPGVVLTDPPYGIGLGTDWKARGLLGAVGSQRGTPGHQYPPVKGDDKPYDPAPIFEHFGSCPEIFLWGADYYAERIPNRLAGSWIVWDKRKESQADAIGAEFELCWSKAPHKRRVLRHDWFGFVSSANGDEARHRLSPTQKPSSLFRDVLTQWAPAGAIVVDQYAGSGVTMIAAEQTGRAARCVEAEPGYCDVIRRRYAEFVNDPSLAP